MNYLNQNSFANSSKCTFSDLCFWLMTIDILFLPYLSFISVSASVSIAAIWTLMNLRKICHDREGKAFILMISIMFFGMLMTKLYPAQVHFETTISTSIKRFFQYILCFCFYFFYRSYFSHKRPPIDKIIFIAIIYITIFAIFYKFFPYKYASLKILINPADNHTRRYLANMVIYRFNYLWTDPNNIAYFIVGVSSWFFLQKKATRITKLIVCCLTIFIVLCTVSNGGLLTLAVMIAILSFINMINVSRRNGAVKKNTLFFILFTIISLLIIVSLTPIGEIIYNKYILNYLVRLEYYFDFTSAPSLSGGRLEDLIQGLKILSPITILIGTGQEGIVTEIGHIYWIGMYGFPAYLIFIWLMFRKYNKQYWKSYIWILPFFIGFTVNIAIGEFKWMATYLMLLAYCRCSPSSYKITPEIYGKRNLDE